MKLGKIRADIDRRFRLPRMWSNRELVKFSHLLEGDVVNVSAGEDVDKEGHHYRDYFSACGEYFMTNYAPGSYRGFAGRDKEILLDLCEELPSELERRFDVVFNHTTLEHVPRPNEAMKNICRMSRDLVIIVVPFLQVQHETISYQDYWRFTPRGLEHLFRDHGCTVVHSAANPHTNASIYLLQVATRFPERWEPIFSSLSSSGNCADPLGHWLGKNPSSSANTSRRLLNKLFRRRAS